MKINNGNEQEKVKLVYEIEHLKEELVQAHFEINAQYANEIEGSNDELGNAHYEINAQYAEVTFLNKEVKRLRSELDNSLSKATDQEKRHMQDIVKHRIAAALKHMQLVQETEKHATEIEHIKAELARKLNKLVLMNLIV